MHSSVKPSIRSVNVVEYLAHNDDGSFNAN